MALTPEEISRRSLVARSYVSGEPVRVPTFRDRFEEQVDPEGELPEKERRRQADAAKRKHFRALAQKRWAKEGKRKPRDETRSDLVASMMRRAATLWNNYRLTPEEYRDLFDAQGGVCALCDSPPGDKPLCVDHDHACCPGTQTCGRCIRGLLCTTCNIWLGAYEKNLVRLERLEPYLTRSDPLGRRSRAA